MKPDCHLQPLACAGNAALDELKARFGDRLSCSASVRELHAGLEGHHPIAASEVVIFGETTDEIAWLARWCSAQKIQWIPHGAGTSLKGHLSAVCCGIALDLSRMTRMFDISLDNLLATVEDAGGKQK